MGALIHFPSHDDPRPEPPAPVPSMCMLRPVEPAMTNAVSIRVLLAPSKRLSVPLSQPLPLRIVA